MEIIGLLDLPPDVLQEILARLSLKTLYISKSVCKTFLHNSSYSDDRYFAARHSAHTSPVLIFQVQWYKRILPSSELYLLDPEHDIAMARSWSNGIFPTLTEMKNPIVQLAHNNKYGLVNSCNGLIFLVHLMEPKSIVCNPITNEYIVIPLDKGESFSATNKWLYPMWLRCSVPFSATNKWLYPMWLGCSAASNQYKILKLSKSVRGQNRPSNRIEILDVGSDSWRVIGIGDTVSWFSSRYSDSYTFLDGVIYWASYVTDGSTITFFDFEREEFGVLKEPQNSVENHRVVRTVVGVHDGCLCLVYCLSLNSREQRDIHSFVLWILRKNGNDKQWSKMFITDDIRNTGKWFTTVQVVKNGAILLHSYGGHTLLYDPKDKSVRIERGDHEYIRIVTVNPSFISLKEILRLSEETLNFR